MAKVKIYELKNMINEQNRGKEIESKNIQDYLEKNLGVKKTHSSSLEDNEVQMVKKYFMPPNNKPADMSPAKPVPANNNGVNSYNNQRSSDQSNQGRQQYPSSSGMAQGQRQGQRPSAPYDGSRQTGTNQANYQNQRPSGTSVNNQGGMRPGQFNSQQSSQQRPAGQGGMRTPQQSQYGNAQRPMNNQTNQQGYNQRPAGAQGSYGQRSADTNQRPAGTQGGYGQRTTDANQRPAGQGGVRQGQQGNMNQRPQEGGQRSYNSNDSRPRYQDQRPNGGGAPRGNYQGQQNSGYQGGQRPAGQGQRPAGQGNGYSGGSDQGYQRTGYQGQRPAGQGNTGYSGGSDQGNQRTGYQGQRPAGQGNGTYQNRPRPYNQDGTRYQGQGGNRPAGQDGQRPPYRSNGEGQQGGGYNNYNRQDRPGGAPRPYGGGQGGQRPAGQRPAGGYNNNRGFDDFKKDEDDKPGYVNRGQGARKPGAGRTGGERKNFDQQILDQKVAEKNDYSNKRNRDRINKEKTYKDKNLVARDSRDTDADDKIKTKLAPRKGQFIQPKPIIEKPDEIKTITLPEVLTIKELADKMKLPGAALVKKLFLAGKMVSVNHEITYEEAEEIALGYDIISEKEVKVNEVEELLKEEDEDVNTLLKRPPVVCVMGHVDHGKTSLLDAIRETNVTSREAGGITQHIGAYVVEVNGEKITFLDTPGHEAFTSMRMRGAKSTDIAILVVAADDGVMPQTIEAINHAKAAGVQIIVAINKIDKPSANVERVKQELTEYELIAEDWGGDTIFVPVSAHTKEGIEQLLEMILLTAELTEIKANPDRKARGIVIEAELDKGRGPVATILVQKGTLHVGDNVVVGSSFGKVRAMMDDKGRRVKEALPSTPVEILGLNEVPDAGEIFIATDNEKEARTISEAFISQGKEKLLADTKAKLSLDGLFSQIQAGNIKELNLIIKADVQGSVEAMKQSLVKLSNEEVAVRIIHGGVGAINESDVILASASNAIIIGFNVRPDNAAKETADREKVDVKFYRVIYNAISDVEAAMKGMLDPIFEEKIMGHAEVRQTFKASGIGTIAGSYVLDGKIVRGSLARIFRGNDKIFEGNLASVKRFQDDVKEVAAGYECGLVFEKFNDLAEGDRVELYNMVEVPR